MAKWREEHPEERKYHDATSRARLRKGIIDAYGGECLCCGITEDVFLTIHHIEGKGNEHRRSLFNGRTGGSIYRWLRQNGYPEGFMILCFNCNYAEHAGGCPHKRH